MLQPSEEIKSRLDIVDVVREYVNIKAAGVNFKANCPFHREKTPSFMVSPEKQIWHCFGCGKGGDIFTFIEEIEGVGFAEALRILAPKAGVTLKKQNYKLVSQRNRLLDILEASANYYHDILLNNERAKPAREYIHNRGLTVNTIKDWKIGYSPDSWDDLVNWLQGKGYKENEIFLAGMSVKKEGANRFYNRFRGRIMFPISDSNGSIVAFSARVSPEKESEEKLGKYINSPQTLIYDKSKILFGLEKAKMEIKSKELAIITEGQMDVITAHQHGYKNVIASSGTALTKEQINLIKRYTNNIALAFDMDKAGEMAADRGINEAMRAEMNIKVIELDEGKDPDEFIQNNPGEWERVVDGAKPVMEYYFDKIIGRLNIDKIEDKREATRKLLPIILKLGNNIERDHWIRKLSEKLDINEHALREAIKGVGEKEGKKEEHKITAQKKEEKITKEELLSNFLLVLVLKFPLLIEYTMNNIGIDHVSGAVNKTIYRNIIILYNNINESDGSGEFTFQKLRAYLNEELAENLDKDDDQEKLAILSKLDRLALLGDRDFYDFNDEKAKGELIKIIGSLKKNYLMQRMKEIQKMIAQSEKEKDNARLNELMQEYKALSDEMISFDK